MEKKTYSVEGQTIMVTITKVNGSNEFTDLPKVFAIATSIDNAVEIAASLNALNNLLESKQD